MNAFGRVYGRNKGSVLTEVIKKLFIVDGSVILGVLAANPTMAVAA